jgi:hypothetical protein
VYGSGVPVSSCSLLIRGNLRRSQAENPLNPLSRFPRPPLTPRLKCELISGIQEKALLQIPLENELC